MKRTCIVDGCEGERLARAWCPKHYRRWRLYGDPLSGGPEAAAPYRGQLCAIDGCYRPAAKRGWCGMHYQRWAKHTDPTYEPKRREGCSVEGCARPHQALGLCGTHYQRLLRNGDPTILLNGRGKPVEVRFMMKVVDGPLPERRPELGPCWIWMGSSCDLGYGHFWTDEGRCPRAHRWSYEYFVGAIPEGLLLDHLCHRPACVNPDHLEPVTNGENVRRGYEWRPKVERCPKGHPYDEENTLIDRHGKRRCRTCNRARCLREYYARKAAA